MNKKLGFIGCGNMAKAIIGGILDSGLLKPEDIIASDVNRAALEKAQETLKITVSQSNTAVASGCEVLVLAVKPQFYLSVIEEISSSVAESTVVVTIAPGQTLKKLKEMFGRKVKLVRTMPNTPAMVCAGMTALCKNELVTEQEFEYVCSLLNCFGKTEEVAEYMMDAVVAVSGSSPAYVYMMIEAMADAAVMGGMPRDKAYTFAAQAVLGSAKMVLETGLHPGALKDMVCSPAGTTIEAVKVLEEKGFRSSIIDAMQACIDKSRTL